MYLNYFKDVMDYFFLFMVTSRNMETRLFKHALKLLLVLITLLALATVTFLDV